VTKRTVAHRGRSKPSSRKAHAATVSCTTSAAPADTQVEVVGRAKRRHASASEKRRILAAADRCTQPGELGAMLRREGVYSSSLSTWRRQRDAAEAAALAPQKRGPKVEPNRADALHIAQLTRENERLKRRLDNAMLVIEVQKKLASLMGFTLDENGERI
jgi:hypothetical protein